MLPTPIVNRQRLGVSLLSLGLGGCITDTSDTRQPDETGDVEICDGLDDNCDDDLPWDETELDGDGWLSCEGDCRPYDAQAYPGATELSDGHDDDCDGDGSGEDDADGDATGRWAGKPACSPRMSPRRWWTAHGRT